MDAEVANNGEMFQNQLLHDDGRKFDVINRDFAVSRPFGDIGWKNKAPNGGTKEWGKEDAADTFSGGAVEHADERGIVGYQFADMRGTGLEALQ